MLHIQTGTDNSILRTESKPVKEVTKKTLKLIEEMEETMQAEKGVGIAAPQVGENTRVILVLIDLKKTVSMINPEILSHGEKMSTAEEGCLSLPGEWGQVERYTDVTVQYLDPKGQKKIVKLTGFNARVAQHEIDHLNGVLFIDHVKMEANFLMLPQDRETERL